MIFIIFRREKSPLRGRILAKKARCIFSSTPLWSLRRKAYRATPKHLRMHSAQPCLNAPARFNDFNVSRGEGVNSGVTETYNGLLQWDYRGAKNGAFPVMQNLRHNSDQKRKEFLNTPCPAISLLEISLPHEKRLAVLR